MNEPIELQQVAVGIGSKITQHLAEMLPSLQQHIYGGGHSGGMIARVLFRRGNPALGEPQLVAELEFNNVGGDPEMVPLAVSPQGNIALISQQPAPTVAPAAPPPAQPDVQPPPLVPRSGPPPGMPPPQTWPQQPPPQQLPPMVAGQQHPTFGGYAPAQPGQAPPTPMSRAGQPIPSGFEEQADGSVRPIRLQRPHLAGQGGDMGIRR